MTAQGHPRAIFNRAVERGNLVVAEATARELGKLSLEEGLGLLFLYAEKEPIKFERAALRWLARYVTEGKAVSLLKRSSRSLPWPSFEPESERPQRSSSLSWCEAASGLTGQSPEVDRPATRPAMRKLDSACISIPLRGDAR